MDPRELRLAVARLVLENLNVETAGQAVAEADVLWGFVSLGREGPERPEDTQHTYPAATSDPL
jgi:hypothetical protein